MLSNWDSLRNALEETFNSLLVGMEPLGTVQHIEFEFLNHQSCCGIWIVGLHHCGQHSSRCAGSNNAWKTDFDNAKRPGVCSSLVTSECKCSYVQSLWVNWLPIWMKETLGIIYMVQCGINADITHKVNLLVSRARRAFEAVTTNVVQ
jgi:hypothetical protein